METSNIKNYAPKARVAFMDAVAKRLNTFGISANKKGELQVIDALVQGSILQIGDNNFDSKLAPARQRLVESSEQQGYEQFIEQVAYTWFNRLCAIRYMEIHDYLGHGFRVLSHPSGDTRFEILDHAQDAAEDLGLDRERIIDLMLAGDKNEELYRELLLGQCHKLHEAMPFLFESLNDETELLLPDNLTRTDSILRGLVDSIPEEDWQQVEVIGWLYQFYISDKKDEVIGKVVKSEDIPAATQLFTPNWIVKYLVQNSVGRHWLQTYPDSPIKEEMEYYIEPAEQTDEVNEQLKAITPESIDPESIKVLDPASGSGHILIEAYNVLKAIYAERGHRSRDIPKLILENNLYGLDIDDRAAQLSGFSLMMMARQDDRRIFSRDVQLNVLSLQETGHLDLPKLWQDLNLSGDWASGATQDMFGGDLDLSSFEADNRYQLLQRNIERFKQAKTFGSLIEVPAAEHDSLKELHDTMLELSESGDAIQRAAAGQIIDVVHQALLLSIRYDAVVANPPYMGSKYQSAELKSYLKKYYKGYDKDLFSAFIVRNLKLSKNNGKLGFMTPLVWMFLTSYENLRNKLLEDEVISTLIQLEYSGFDGATVPICTFTITKGYLDDYISSYIRLSDFRGASNQGPKTLEAINNKQCEWFYQTKSENFKKLPGSPIAYWLEDQVFESIGSSNKLSNIASSRAGMTSGNNDYFTRQWYEIDFSTFSDSQSSWETAINSGYKWFPYNKGGSYRKWYGNITLALRYDQKYRDKLKNTGNKCASEECYFQEGLTWTDLTSGPLSARFLEKGAVFDIAGHCAFPKVDNGHYLSLGLMNTNYINSLSKVINATMHFQPGDFKKLPYPSDFNESESESESESEIVNLVKSAVTLSKRDWEGSEISWNFNIPYLIKNYTENKSIKDSYGLYVAYCNSETEYLQGIEVRINKIFNEKFGVSEFYSSEVPLRQITLIVNPIYLFSNLDSSQERFKSKTIVDLTSYVVGCMMGRYSLDQEGLVYAHHAGNKDFDTSLYQTFLADSDGIIPITDEEWFKDDVSNRVVEFVKTVWGEEKLSDNLQFIADSLCLDAIKPKKSETSIEAIRRYLSTQFYKDHMQTYKNRPIYWLFSSGKEKAFECLVYLHRYNESTLSRMRTEYVTPLLGKYQAYAEQLDKQIEMAESTQDKKRLERELKSMDKKQSELREFDDKLKHYADMRISIDLDDGVKENYGRFGDLLSDVKKITGKNPEIVNAN